MLARLLGFCLLATLGAGGCIAPTYVNIPSEGGLAASDVNSFNVREVVANSVAAAVERETMEGPYEVLLPEGASQGTYQTVVRQIAGGAVAPDTLRDGAIPTVQVVAVRIRNQSAECDVVRPSPTGRSVVRVFLSYYIGGDWAVQRVTPLRISPEDLLLPEAAPEGGADSEPAQGPASGGPVSGDLASGDCA